MSAADTHKLRTSSQPSKVQRICVFPVGILLPLALLPLTLDASSLARLQAVDRLLVLRMGCLLRDRLTLGFATSVRYLLARVSVLQSAQSVITADTKSIRLQWTDQLVPHHTMTAWQRRNFPPEELLTCAQGQCIALIPPSPEL